MTGYDVTTWFVRAEECGAAMWDGHLVTFCRSKNHPVSSATVPTELGTDTGPRSCANALCFTGIGRHAWVKRRSCEKGTHHRFH